MKTTQDAKAYLSRYNDIGRDILALLDERQKTEDILLRLSPNLHAERVQGGPLPSPGAAIDKLVDLNREIEQQTERLRAARQEIAACIESIEDPRYRMVLKFKYMDGLSNTGIADRTGYDERHVRRLHHAALAELDTKFSEMS